MVYDYETGQRRWLLKAVREASGELLDQFRGLSESQLRQRPAEGEWCLKEVAAHLRDAELLYRRQIEAISRRRRAQLPHEALDVLPAERDYTGEPVQRLLYEYAEAREETVWLLRGLDEDDWQRAGVHPYRGEVTLYDIVRELHMHDLEHLHQARKLREWLLG